MSVLTIFVKGDECLEKRCHEVTKFDRRLRLLVRDLKETLADVQGVGLAAPQIGILRRVFVLNVDGEFKEYINPVILERNGEQTPIEGCLSLPGVWGRVRRAESVRIGAYDAEGNYFEESAQGLIAEAYEHECDHLDGKLFDELIYEYCDPEDFSREREGDREEA